MNRSERCRAYHSRLASLIEWRRLRLPSGIVPLPKKCRFPTHLSGLMLRMFQREPSGPKSRTNGGKKNGAPSSAAQWVDAIKIARQLLKATGSVANATALLKAVEG
jgi:hypothetical protein